MTDTWTEWDPTLQTNPGAATPNNRGCGDGYGAEYVAPGQAMAVALRPGDPNGTWIRCRYVGTATAADIASETGTSVGESIGIATGAIGDTLKQIKEGLPTGFDLKLGLVVVGIAAIAVLAVLYGPRRR